MQDIYLQADTVLMWLGTAKEMNIPPIDLPLRPLPDGYKDLTDVNYEIFTTDDITARPLIYDQVRGKYETFKEDEDTLFPLLQLADMMNLDEDRRDLISQNTYSSSFADPKRDNFDWSNPKDIPAFFKSPLDSSE